MLHEELGFAETSRAPGEFEMTGEDIARFCRVIIATYSRITRDICSVEERREKKTEMGT